MTATVLDATTRSETGKNKVKKLRNEGVIPCVVYGGKADPELLTVELRTLEKLYNRSPYGRNTIIELAVDGKATKVISKSFERHPVSGRIEHVDFLRIEKGKAVTVNVPVKLSGTAAGQKMGGVLLPGLAAIRIVCQPDSIPQSVEADVSSLQLGTSLQVKDLTIEGAKILSMPYEILATVEVPRAEKSAAASAAAGEGAEEGAEGEEGGKQESAGDDE